MEASERIGWMAGKEIYAQFAEDDNKTDDRVYTNPVGGKRNRK
jgi:hypothetical protein